MISGLYVFTKKYSFVQKKINEMVPFNEMVLIQGYLLEQFRGCLKITDGNLPGNLVVKTLSFYCRGIGSIPDQETKTPHAVHCGQKNPKKTNKIHVEVCLFFFLITDARALPPRSFGFKCTVQWH